MRVNEWAFMCLVLLTLEGAQRRRLHHLCGTVRATLLSYYVQTGFFPTIFCPGSVCSSHKLCFRSRYSPLAPAAPACPSHHVVAHSYCPYLCFPPFPSFNVPFCLSLGIVSDGELCSSLHTTQTYLSVPTPRSAKRALKCHIARCSRSTCESVAV